MSQLANYVGESWLFPLKSALNLFQEEIAPVLSLRKQELMSQSDETGQVQMFTKESQVFRALQGCPYPSVRFVVIGEKPIPSEFSTGLCFDQRINTPTNQMSASCRCFLRLLQSRGTIALGNPHSYLEHLPRQGVLLLNSQWTTEKVAPERHELLPWRKFTEELVLQLQKIPRPITWVLMGKNKGLQIANDRHTVVRGPLIGPASLRFWQQNFPFHDGIIW